MAEHDNLNDNGSDGADFSGEDLSFSDEKERLFQKRYEEGWDMNDPEYASDLKLTTPQN